MDEQLTKRGAEKKERLLSKDYLLIIFAATGTSFMNFFFFSSLPLYVGRLGGTSLQAGTMTTVYSLAALAARPAAGVISDKIGRVKLLVAGAFICAVTCALFGMVSVIPVLLIIRAVNGIGFGMHSTCAGAVAADVLPKSRLAEGIGYFGLYSTLGQALAPGIALAIIAKESLGDFKVLFFSAAALCSVSMVLDACLTYERRKKRAAAESVLSAEAEKDKTPVKVKKDGRALPKTILGFEYAVFAPAAVMMLMHFGLAGIMSFITPFAKWKGFENPGLYFTVSASGVLAARLFFGKLADRRGADIVIIPGIVMLTVCLALLPFVGSMTALAIIAFPLGLSQGAVMPIINSMLFKRCSPERRGTASGAYFSAVDIGFAIGAPLLGAIADAADYRYVYWVAAAFVLLALALYVPLASDKRYNAKHNLP